VQVLASVCWIRQFLLVKVENGKEQLTAHIGLSLMTFVRLIRLKKSGLEPKDKLAYYKVSNSNTVIYEKNKA
jgi:hypothetical protein